MNIDWNLYKVFCKVAELKNMTKAAEELEISQPAVTKSIKLLESQLGETLFIRSNKGLEFTEEGQMFYDEISGMTSRIASAEDGLKEYKNLEKGCINIGISSVLTKLILLEPLETFKNDYPNIKISITNGLTSELLDLLNKGKLDFVILNGDESIKNVSLIKITKLSYSFIYNPLYHKISSDIKIKDLMEYPLLLQKNGSNTREVLNEYFIKKGINPHNITEAVSQDLICEFTRIGMGIGFAFDKLVETRYTDLKKINLKETFETDIYVAKNKSVKNTYASREIIKYILNQYKE